MVKGSDLKVDEDKCVGCGACVVSFEQLFKLNNEGKSEPIKSAQCSDCNIEEVIDICPQGAIMRK